MTLSAMLDISGEFEISAKNVDIAVSRQYNLSRNFKYSRYFCYTIVRRKGEAMTETEVRMLRFLQQAYALTCGVALDVCTKELLLFPGGSQDKHVFLDIRSAQSWLRGFAHCEIHGRRCSAGDCGL